MGEKMAKVEIEQEAVPVSELWRDALQRADKALGRMSKGLRAATFVGLIAGITTASQAKEWGAIVSPAVLPTESKSTTLELSAAQIPPAPEIETAPEYAERLPVEVEEKTPIEVEVSVEQTAKFLQGLEEKVDEIKRLRSLRVGDDPEIPTPAIGKIFTKLENDIHIIRSFTNSDQNETSRVKEAAKEIITYWSGVPVEIEGVKEIEIFVDPITGEQGRWVETEIKNLVDLFPDLGQTVGKIEIVPRTSKDPLRGRIWTYPDRPATIRLYDTKEEGKQWTRESLTLAFSHELRHAISLYGEGYVLTLLTPSEVIELVYEDTVLWDIIYRPDGGKPVFGGNEEEDNAFFAESLLSSGGSSIGFQPTSRKEEIIEKARSHLEKLYGLVLNEERNIVELSEVLRVK